MTQSTALSILMTGANVFLTGEPGAGKTHTINLYTAYLRSRGIDPAITASTGIAATHIGGMTIHSWSGIGIKTKLEKSDLSKIISNSYIQRRVCGSPVLIIEEVSMLSPETLSMVDVVCKTVRRNSQPFGGIQVVFSGDFFQLPPVVKRELNKAGQGSFLDNNIARFAFESFAWTDADPAICYLTEQHRQDDSNFLDLLTAIRRNIFDSSHLRHIVDRKIAQDKAPKNAPKLFSHNADVDRVNDEVLTQLPGNVQEFVMASVGPEVIVAALKKGCISPEVLEVKINAAVMFTKNNPKEGFVNGTLGTVVGFDEETTLPIVKIRNGRKIEVEPMDWSVEENGKVRAKISQIPLRLAWAITVHKSQGMSLDEAVVDLSDVFEFGQGYVALSRVRRLSGLYVLGWNDRAFQVHPEVLLKDEVFKKNSSSAERMFSGISSGEIKKMHDDFIVASGGKVAVETRIISKKKAPAETGFDEIRKTYPSAYSPWDSSQDEKLEKLFRKGESTGLLSKTFGRKPGAIRSRLIKLGLVHI